MAHSFIIEPNYVHLTGMERVRYLYERNNNFVCFGWVVVRFFSSLSFSRSQFSLANVESSLQSRLNCNNNNK